MGKNVFELHWKFLGKRVILLVKLLIFDTVNGNMDLLTCIKYYNIYNCKNFTMMSF